MCVDFIHVTLLNLVISSNRFLVESLPYHLQTMTILLPPFWYACLHFFVCVIVPAKTSSMLCCIRVVMMQRDLIGYWGGIGRSHRKTLPEIRVNSLGGDWLRSWMPPEHMELWARRFKIKEGRQWLSDSLLWGCLDGPAAADCVSQRMVF